MLAAGNEPDFGTISVSTSQKIRTMRTYWRQWNDLLRSAGRHIQRMQKALTQMNLQLGLSN